jgi:hypothetical protein
MIYERDRLVLRMLQPIARMPRATRIQITRSPDHPLTRFL